MFCPNKSHLLEVQAMFSKQMLASVLKLSTKNKMPSKEDSEIEF